VKRWLVALASIVAAIMVVPATAWAAQGAGTQHSPVLAVAARRAADFIPLLGWTAALAVVLWRRRRRR
jgi:hypothetical protein